MGICTVIAAHNAADTIARAVKSALAEPETAEVIVVDDASADGTAARARAADDSSGRLKILTQPANAGPSAARNRAIAESKAPWIAILDADDFFLPERFKRLLALESDADFIADDIGQVFEGAIDGSRKSLLGLEQLPIGKNRTSSSPLAGEVRRGGEKPGISVNDQQTGKASSSVTPPPLTPPARGGEQRVPKPTREGRGIMCAHLSCALPNVSISQLYQHIHDLRSHCSWPACFPADTGTPPY
jgi:hypothetical protein